MRVPKVRMLGGHGKCSPRKFVERKENDLVHSRVVLAQIFSHVYLIFATTVHIFYLDNYLYWCSIIPHQPILLVWHAAPTESISAVNAAPVSMPMTNM